MITKTISYKGFDGENIEEVIRLHLTKAEVMNLDLKYSDYGGLINYLRKILTDVKNDGSYLKPLITVLQTLILAAYGKKLDDGKFVKKINGVPLADEFESSEAYSELLIHLLSEEGTSEIEPLILGIFPADMVDQTAFNKNKDKVMSALNS